VSDPHPPGQQWDSPEQTDLAGWQSGRSERQSAWSQQEPQVNWNAQTQPGWDQQTPQPGWDQQVPQPGSDQQVPQPGWDQQQVPQPGWDQQAPQPGWSPSEPAYEAQYEGGWPAEAQPDVGGWPTGSQPDAGAHRHYQAAAHTQSYTAVRVLAQLTCLALIITGLSVRDNGVRGWTDLTAWAIFAAAAAVVQTAPLVGRGFGLDAATSWTVGAVATASLVAYWVIIVLPSVSTNAGFALTMGTAVAVIGSWLSPGRQL
jgi:hypothetical protein